MIRFPEVLRHKMENPSAGITKMDLIRLGKQQTISYYRLPMI